MGSPAPRRTQADRTELSGQLLLTAAGDLVAEKGWEATTAADISRRAGYSRAMVHARFGGKDGLLDALMRVEYEDRLNPRPDADDDGLHTALAILVRLEELHEEAPEFLRAMLVLSFESVKQNSAARPRIVRWMDELSTGVLDGFTHGLDDGSVRPDTDPEQATTALVAGAVGAAWGWLALPSWFDFPTEMRLLRNRLLQDYGRH